MTSAVETSMNRVTGGTSRIIDWMSDICSNRGALIDSEGTS